MGRLGKLGDALVDSMAAAIQQMEGYFPPGSQYPKGSVAYQNNNPGNLMFAGQAGASPGGVAGFARFSSYDAGYAALKNQIQYQINKGQNLTEFFLQYAPPSTSNAAGAVQTSSATQNYINYVAQQVGVDPTVPLSQYQSGQFDTTDTSGGTGNPILDAINNADPTILIAVTAGAAIGLALLLSKA